MNAPPTIKFLDFFPFILSKNTAAYFADVLVHCSARILGIELQIRHIASKVPPITYKRVVEVNKKLAQGNTVSPSIVRILL